MARITFDQLKTFLYVIRLGGVRKAAHGLSLTQPAITTRIKGARQALALHRSVALQLARVDAGITDLAHSAQAEPTSVPSLR